MYSSISRLHRQSGTVLLTFLLIFIVGSGYVLLDQLNANAPPGVHNLSTQYVLAQAKEALIAHAVLTYDISLTNQGHYGYLPCPDANPLVSPEGNQDPNCGITNVSSIGKLPWRTLGIQDLRDASGECLWYAVSSQFKNAPKTAMMNEDSYGTFNITTTGGTNLAGNTPADRAVAVIIAPGEIMGNQNRAAIVQAPVCGGNYNTANYLETIGVINNSNVSGAVDAIDPFIAATDQSDMDPDNAQNINDVMVFITADEIFNRITNRPDYSQKLFNDTAINNLTRRLAECVVEYGQSHAGANNSSLPWPAPVDLVDYRFDAQYDDLSAVNNTLSGRLPDIVDSSNAIIPGNGEPATLITACTLFDLNPGPLLTLQQELELLRLWQNWKDHFFYAVSDAYQPGVGATSPCSNGTRCVTINSDPPGDDYAAVVIFSNSPLAAQVRDAPPFDVDTKSNIGNYLEDVNNMAIYQDTAGNDTKRFDLVAVSNVFNDIYYCINNDDGGATEFTITVCPTN